MILNSVCATVKFMNPSAWKPRILLAVITAVATGIATYMSLFQWGLIAHVWDPFFSTDKVLTSDVSRDLKRYFLIPDAALGAISYLGDAVLSLVGSKTRWKDKPWLVLLFGVYVIPPAAVSVVLVALQGLVVKAWCFLCFITAAISVVSILLSYNEVKVTVVYLCRVWQRCRSGKILWNTIRGIPSAIADQEAELIALKKSDH
jgi:uncharacterized membrane protein